MRRRSISTARPDTPATCTSAFSLAGSVAGLTISSRRTKVSTGRSTAWSISWPSRRSFVAACASSMLGVVWAGPPFALRGRTVCVSTGVSLSHPQIGIARRYAVGDHIEAQVDFVHGSCSRHLLCPNASLDAMVCIASACHYRDRPTFFSEVRRVRKPGAPLVAMVGSPSVHRPTLPTRSSSFQCARPGCSPRSKTPIPIASRSPERASRSSSSAISLGLSSRISSLSTRA